MAKIDPRTKLPIGQIQPGNYLYGVGKYNPITKTHGYVYTQHPSGLVVAQMSPPPPIYHETIPYEGKTNVFRAIRWMEANEGIWKGFPLRANYEPEGAFGTFWVQFDRTQAFPPYTGGLVSFSGSNYGTDPRGVAFALLATNGANDGGPYFGTFNETLEITDITIGNLNINAYGTGIDGYVNIPFGERNGIGRIIYTVNH